MENEKRLETMSWNEIDKIARAGEGRKYFSVGDEKTITLDDGEQVTLQILGFDHDDLADGTGKANITFGMKNLLATEYKMNDTRTNVGGWGKCKMRTKTMPMLFNKLPADLRGVIKTVDKKTTAGNKSTDIKISHDNLFLFSEMEVGITGRSEGTIYEYWSEHSVFRDKIKKMSNGIGGAEIWWFRSPYVYDDDYFGVIWYGGINDYSTASGAGGVCFGFCV